ncbi:hypothetical protein V493_05543 [Pseudogymnoascus sp. VKM F-4281 (FW-2241)]|nr:hypothetical protein V493_05543 [Pseudogymnoascus sp. VKM F-4281 (FW-2241)]
MDEAHDIVFASDAILSATFLSDDGRFREAGVASGPDATINVRRHVPTDRPMAQQQNPYRDSLIIFGHHSEARFQVQDVSGRLIWVGSEAYVDILLLVLVDASAIPMLKEHLTEATKRGEHGEKEKAVDSWKLFAECLDTPKNVETREEFLWLWYSLPNSPRA